METTPTQMQASSPETKLLAEFLHEMNITRRGLTLYPPAHPQIAAATKKTIECLDKLLQNRTRIAFGVAPKALYFENQWLDKKNPVFKTFAGFLSGFGIASLSFKRGVSTEELIRFCQLLRSDRHTIEDHGGFNLLLQQQRISGIDIVSIDYSAFQSNTEQSDQALTEATDLWKDFLHGLLENRLDPTDDSLHLSPQELAEILNEKLIDENTPVDLPTNAVSKFVERFLSNPASLQTESSGHQLAELLNHLSPQLHASFLNGAFLALEKNPATIEHFFEKLSPAMLSEALALQAHQKLQISPRLVGLVNKLAADPDSSTQTNFEGMEKEMVRARLDALFSEEQHNSYSPETYQATLQNILDTETTINIPEEAKVELREQFEKQSIELQSCAIIFELLANHQDLDDEEAIQQNLLDLSRFFLDTGNFTALREIYQNWFSFVHGNQSSTDIFQEKLLASHIQQSFMEEVLKAYEIWGEEQHETIRRYIATVGAPYTEPIIKQLGEAKSFNQRRYLMDLLGAIGADADQLLVQALADERWYLIRNLLIVLRKNLKPATLKAVQRLVDHPHPKVRQEVIRILFHCTPATANRMLLKEFNHGSPEARLSAMQVADLSQDPEVLGYLHKQLQTGISSNFDLKYKKQVLNALASIGSVNSLNLLSGLLQKRGLLRSNFQKQFQTDIIQSLIKYPHGTGKKLLQEIASSGQRKHAKLAGELLRRSTGDLS